MKPPIPNRLLVEDFQDAPTWFGRLISVLNRFMEQTIAVLDKGVSFGDNILARTFSTNFNTTAAYATGTFEPINFTWTGSDLPSSVLITRIVKADGTPFLGSVGTPQWVYNSGNIVISYIPGLAVNTRYTFTFLAF